MKQDREREARETSEAREGGSPMNEKIVYAQESYAIKGACLEVYKVLGCGFLESVYQECLNLEFIKRNIPFNEQKQLALLYNGTQLKQTYKVDFVCYDKVIVELKAVSKLTEEHKSQVMNYLKATGYHLGLLYNFGHYPGLEEIRIVNTKS
jgi:GxxExxY protein